MPEVDLNMLQLNTLKRYKKHYKIPSKPTMNKTQLAEVINFKNFFVNLRACINLKIFGFSDADETFEDNTCC